MATPTQPNHPQSQPAGKGKMVLIGLLIGGVVLSLILVAGAAFMWLRGGSTETPTIEMPAEAEITLAGSPFPVFPGATTPEPTLAGSMGVPPDGVGLVAANTSVAGVTDWYQTTLPTQGYTQVGVNAGVINAISPTGQPLVVNTWDMTGGGQIGIIAAVVTAPPMAEPTPAQPPVEIAPEGEVIAPAQPMAETALPETAPAEQSDSIEPVGDDAVSSLPDTTKVLSDATTQYLVSVSDDDVTYTFSQSTPELAELTAGDVMVSGVSTNAPYGFLRKVTSVSSSGGQVVVQTEAGTLADAIGTGSFEINIDMSSDQIQTGTQLPGVSLETQGLNEESAGEVSALEPIAPLPLPETATAQPPVEIAPAETAVVPAITGASLPLAVSATVSPTTIYAGTFNRLGYTLVVTGSGLVTITANLPEGVLVHPDAFSAPGSHAYNPATHSWRWQPDLSTAAGGVLTAEFEAVNDLLHPPDSLVLKIVAQPSDPTQQPLIQAVTLESEKY